MTTSNSSQSSRGNPNYIAGVFNYCDRWCERCPLTDRCRCYAMLKKRNINDSASADANDAEFLEALRRTFQETKEALLQTVAEQGIDLDDPVLTEELEEHEKSIEGLVAKHDDLLQKARSYACFVSGILSRGDSRTDQPAVCTRNTPLFERRTEIAEAVEVISYYHAFIYIKLSRALHSLAEEELETDRFMRESSSDADGSAKVALIGIDRSWLAWGSLLRHLAQGDETVFDALTQLSALREMTELTFPAARSFMRPGFDA